MPKLKVLALSYLFPNSVSPNHGVFVYNRLNALSEFVDIKVINPIPWSPVHRAIAQYAPLANVPYKTRRGNLDIFHPRFFSIPKYAKAIEAVSYRKAVERVLNDDLKDYAFDLVDMHWTFPDLPAGVAIANQSQKPSVLTLRGVEAFHLQDGDARTRIVQRLISSPDQIVALSRELKSISIRLGAEPERHQVIRNGVDSSLFHFIDQNQARNTLGLQHDKTIIVAVGALIKRKGFDLILEALSNVKRRCKGRNIELHIIGVQGPEGDYRKSLFSLVERLNLQDSVFFDGAVANDLLPYWYNAADVFCLASRGEGSPNVLTEALACGCPAVATHVGAVKEIIDSEPDIGVCVLPESASALEQGLVEVLEKTHHRQLNAKVFGHYDWRWCAKSVLDVYDRALGH